MLANLSTVFPEIPPEILATASDRMYEVEVGRGFTIMEEGEQDCAVLFVIEGYVAVRVGEFEIATIGPGGLIGEIGLFGGALRTASVRALSSVVFIALDRYDYDAMLSTGHPVAYAVEKLALRQLSLRLREADSRIAGLGSRIPLDLPEEFNGRPVTRSIDPLDVLKHSRLFSDSPIGAIDDVARRFQPRAFEAGEVLCRQGNVGDDLYVLASGTVEVLVDTDGSGAESVAVLERGDVFGMASVLQQRPRMASCIALEPVIALRMDAASCLALTNANERSGSVLRVGMIRALADQVAYANAQFSQMSMDRQRRTSELLARLGIEAHGRHINSSK